MTEALWLAAGVGLIVGLHRLRAWWIARDRVSDRWRGEYWRAREKPEGSR